MNWRLIRDGAATGARNMALDEAMLRCQAGADARPTLRFYRWNPSCLSLGRFQKTFAVALDIDVVRRPTGGRAVWHQHEITYSAAFPLDIVPASATSVIGSYRWLTRAFLNGLREVGVVAELEKAIQSTLRSSQNTLSGANCFLATAACDSVVDGRKLIGAAQCRKTIDGRVVVLQHGSLLLDVDVEAWRGVLGTEAAAMRGGVMTLAELGLWSSEEDSEAMVAALVLGVQSTLGADVEVATWNEAELDLARQLERVKYRSLRWNRDGRETTESESGIAA